MCDSLKMNTKSMIPHKMCNFGRFVWNQGFFREIWAIAHNLALIPIVWNFWFPNNSPDTEERFIVFSFYFCLFKLFNKKFSSLFFRWETFFETCRLDPYLALVLLLSEGLRSSMASTGPTMVLYHHSRDWVDSNSLLSISLKTDF